MNRQMIADVSSIGYRNGPLLGDHVADMFRMVHLKDLGELESGVYWPRLQPHFLKPYFRRLTYRVTGRTPVDYHSGDVLSTRGASGYGELDIAYIADRQAASLVITDAGLPDYCLTLVTSGSLICAGNAIPGRFDVDASVGLIYRGLPGLSLSATSYHRRLAIWIPATSIQQRLAGLLGAPAPGDLVFEPLFDLASPAGRSIERLAWLLAEELAKLQSPGADNELVTRSFTDVLIYTMLQSLPHSHSNLLVKKSVSPVPGTVRRAEQYMKAHATEPIALHDVAAAAGCSVRGLQVAFKQFREITPTEAILQIRIEAVKHALECGHTRGTVTAIAHQYGFTNPGRFTRLYTNAFGVSPLETLRGAASPSRQRD